MATGEATAMTILKAANDDRPWDEHAIDKGRELGETRADAQARLGKQRIRPRRAKVETPLEKDYREGYLSVDDMMTADHLLAHLPHLYQHSSIPVPANDNVAVDHSPDPLRLIGSEVSAELSIYVRRLRDAAGDRWPHVIASLLGQETMRSLGLANGVPVRRAASGGRELVVEGLRRIGREIARERTARPS